MKIAILGFPQSGKRTLFSLLSGRDIPENRKEGEAIEAVAPVRDSRVDRIAEIARPERIKYAEIRVVLCPDMVTGSGGEREWLEPARRCELLCPLIRAFQADSVYHPKGSVDAERDRRDLESELLLADLELIEKRLDRISKEKRAGQTPAQATEEKTLSKCREAVERGQFLNTSDLSPQELQSINSLGLLTLVPVLWTYNVDESRVGEEQSRHDTSVFAVSCQIEREILDMEDAAERKQYLAELGLDSPGLDRLARAAYDALGLMSFYTMGEDEVRAWTIRKKTFAPAAAGKVHSDIERGFIRVEIIKYDDLIAAGSEAAVRQQGKMHLRGKDYVIEDGDICCFRFNV